MKLELLNKSKVFAIIALVIVTCFLPNSIEATDDDNLETMKNQDIINIGNEGTEYWALLVAVGVYASNPEENRPLMLEEIDDLYKSLVDSPQWSEDHIKVIKGEDATILNIVQGLRWLDRMEDSDDVSLVFITTHGFPLGTDIPPKDEEDGTDEALVSYWGFEYLNLYIWDDELNFLLNRLESQGVCLIVDSCYAGGFNDPPDWKSTAVNDKDEEIVEWIEGFAEDVRAQGRVVLMASHEDEVSYSGGFAPYVIDGLRGYADSNNDDIISAEEVFYYTEPRTIRQHPTMYDGYEGDLPLIYLDGSSKSNENREEGQSITMKQSGSALGNVYGPENSVINGFVKDADSDDPIVDALVSVRGRDYEWEFFENETTTDSNGFYSINVPACTCSITVYADGYCNGMADHIHIDENEVRWINFSLYLRPPENSTVCGYITDEYTGDPIDGASVSLSWRGGQNQYYLNDTVTDYTGFYIMNVAAGVIDLGFEASGYFRGYREDIVISDYETQWVNYSLEPKPVESSVLCGYITDDETGDPIDDARVTIEWVDIELGQQYQNETHSDQSGFYSINVAPGELYLNINKFGYDYYDPYRHDNDEYNVIWYNVSIEPETIQVEIAKPLRALYLNNERIMPFIKSRIIGSIDIEAYVYESWHGYGEAEKVEFYIDGELKATVDTEPYIWTWAEKKIGKHTIKVVAYDYEGNSGSKEIEVYKFL